MKKWLNSINPADNRVGNVLFIAIIAFSVCFICFSLGMRPLYCFRTIEGNIVKFEDEVRLKIFTTKSSTNSMTFVSITLDSSKERFVNMDKRLAKLFDKNKPVKLWYYKPLFSYYYDFGQAEQDGKLLLKTYEVSGLIYLIIMVFSFIIGAICVYIRRDRKSPRKEQRKSQREIDEELLTIAEFTEKYYSADVDIIGWDYWMKTNINMAWHKNTRQAFLDKRSRYRKNKFDFGKMEQFYKEKDLSAFDEDIRRSFAFLAGDGYFEENQITFEKWITIKNFINPKNDITVDLSIKEALDYKGGMNYIRDGILSLHWWR